MIKEIDTMKYEVYYMQYHFLLECDLPNNRESMKVVYKDTLIIVAEFLQLLCKVGYNTEFIGPVTEKELDEVFRKYRGDVLKIMPQLIEVLCLEYVPEFVRIKSIII